MEKSLNEARDYVQKNIKKGVQCPCCGQTAALRKRSIRRDWSLWLIELWRLGSDQEWVSAADIAKRIPNWTGGDYAKLRFWGMIEPKPNDKDPTKNQSGIWRITDKGIQFVKKQLRVPSTALVYNNKCFGFSNDPVSIEDTLKESFDWRVDGQPVGKT